MADGNKRKRENLEEKDKAVFWNILKTEKSGAIWKIITEGKNNTTRHEAWEVVAKAFAAHINSPFTHLQAKQLYKRIKDAKKKEHDRKAIDRDFRKKCSGTGGGHACTPPTDDFNSDIENDLFEFEPVRADFTRMVRPCDRSFFGLGLSSTPKASVTGPRKPLREININSASSTSASLSSPVSGQRSAALPNNNADFSRAGISSEVQEENMEENLFQDNSLVDQEIIIQDGGGGVKKVKPAPRKEKKSKTKKSMNDEAANFYSSKLQRPLVKQKMKYFKRTKK